jgi:hypothetical protein
MKKNVQIELVMSFDELKSFLFDMLGTEHDLAIHGMQVDHEHGTVTFTGIEDKTTARRHNPSITINEIFAKPIVVVPKKKGPYGKHEYKSGLSAYLRDMFAGEVLIPFTKVKALLIRDGYDRPDNKIKSSLVALGIRQRDPGVYQMMKEAVDA